MNRNNEKTNLINKSSSKQYRRNARYYQRRPDGRKKNGK